MRNLLFAIFCFFTINGFSLQPSLADSNTGISIGDTDSVADAVAHITATLEDQGFEIVLVVDHSAAAKSVNLELPPTQVIFARQNRIFERHLLKRSDTIGIDLPLKYLVYQDEDGEIQVISNPVGYLVDRHDLIISDPLLRLLESKVEQFSDAPYGLVTVASRQTMEDTVESLKSVISPNTAFRIPLVLDYDADWWRNRNYRDSHLPVLIVFGNPEAGTPLIQEDQSIGLDLPQKFLVWEDRDGTVNITYNDPFFIAERHNIHGQDARLEVIADALRNFALIGAGSEANDIN
jgi:uncharacterized protein (DUF302 family)